MTTRIFALMPLALLICTRQAAGQTTYTPYTFATLAGNAGYGSADGTGSAARFYRPQGLAADSAGNVYVADTYNDTIRKMSPTGVVTTLAGQAGSIGSTDATGSAARFGNLYGSVPIGPAGVTTDSTGNVYVADTYSHTIRRVTPEGAVTTLAGLAGVSGALNGTGSAARFNYPQGLAVDTNGDVYVADSNNYTLRKVTPLGVVTTLAGLAYYSGSADGTNSAARFYSPTGVALIANGSFYVSDRDNDTIRQVTPMGTNWVVTTAAGLAGGSGNVDGTGSSARFRQPYGMAVDTNGTLFVADSNNHTIRAVTPAGAVTTLAGQAGVPGTNNGTGSAAQFNLPFGVAVDSATNLYVGDCNNQTIRKMTPVGTNWVVSTLAGLAGVSGTNDGTGSAARFFNPSGVAVDTDGNLYVADYSNHAIRKVTPAGMVTTLAGLAGTFGAANGTGSVARFYQPYGVAVDSATNVYVADSGNYTIRKVTPAGVVTTLVGLAGNYGSADGIGSAARFYYPYGVAADANANVCVADYANNTIRKVTPAGAVTTLAGLAGNTNRGSADGTGSAARFNSPYGVAVDSAGNVYVADTGNNVIRKGFPAISAPVIVASSLGFSGGQFSFNLTGPAGQRVVVEASSNLVSDWLPIWTNTFGVGLLPFADAQSGVFSQQFYRARSP
jgi:streptogramin lyase